MGQDAPGLSAATISRLKEVWKEEYGQWSQRDLSGKNYIYLWADGVHFGVRLEDASQCILVIIGATADGKKQLLAMTDGYRESEESWKELLLDLKQRGLTIDQHPKATECLAKDRHTLLTFYDFPAEHWQHIRTTNPIESTFSTVKLRTAKTRGCVSRASMLAMVFKLTKTAEQKWRTLKGHALLAQVVQGVRFKDGLQEGETRIAA